MTTDSDEAIESGIREQDAPDEKASKAVAGVDEAFFGAEMTAKIQATKAEADSKGADRRLVKSLLGRFQNDSTMNAVLERLDAWMRDEKGYVARCRIPFIRCAGPPDWNRRSSIW